MEGVNGVSIPEADEDHPAGEVMLPRRIRAEVKILALVGFTTAVSTVQALTQGCTSSTTASITSY